VATTLTQNSSLCRKKNAIKIVGVEQSLYNYTNPNKRACFIFLQVMGNPEQNAQGVYDHLSLHNFKRP